MLEYYVKIGGAVGSLSRYPSKVIQGAFNGIPTVSDLHSGHLDGQLGHLESFDDVVIECTFQDSMYQRSLWKSNTLTLNPS